MPGSTVVEGYFEAGEGWEGNALNGVVSFGAAVRALAAATHLAGSGRAGAIRPPTPGRSARGRSPR